MSYDFSKFLTDKLENNQPIVTTIKIYKQILILIKDFDFRFVPCEIIDEFEIQCKETDKTLFQGGLENCLNYMKGYSDGV